MPEPKRRGRPPAGSKTGLVGFRIEGADLIRRALRMQAARRGTTSGKQLVVILEKALRRELAELRGQPLSETEGSDEQ